MLILIPNILYTNTKFRVHWPLSKTWMVRLANTTVHARNCCVKTYTFFKVSAFTFFSVNLLNVPKVYIKRVSIQGYIFLLDISWLSRGRKRWQRINLMKFNLRKSKNLYFLERDNKFQLPFMKLEQCEKKKKLKSFWWTLMPGNWREMSKETTDVYSSRKYFISFEGHCSWFLLTTIILV